MKTTTMNALRLGQRFTWIPTRWYGAAKLTEKTRRTETEIKHSITGSDVKFIHTFKYDIKFDAAVVNPPGIEYGVPGKTKVRLLKKGEQVRKP